MKMYDEALASADKSIELGYNDSGFYFLRAQILDKLGDYESALADTSKILEFDSNNNAVRDFKKFLEKKLKI